MADQASATSSPLQGKVILITGGANGLGRDVALQAAEQKAKLAIFDTRDDRMAEVKAAAEATGSACRTYKIDVSSESEVVAAMKDVVEHFGQIDVVVNSAGIYRGGPIVDMTMDDYDLVFRVNVRGTFLICREAAKVMIAQKNGHIINVSSIGAKKVFPNEIAYAASKWAVLGISEGLAAEIGPHNVRITTICPGGMNTPFWDELKAQRENWNPVNLLDSSHVAQAVIQIASLPPDVVIKEALVYSPGR